MLPYYASTNKLDPSVEVEEYESGYHILVAKKQIQECVEEVLEEATISSTSTIYYL